MTWLNKLLRKLFSIREHSDGDVVKPFHHLEDLRGVIFKMIASVVCGTIVSYYFHSDLMELLAKPLDEASPGLHLKGFSVITPFMVSLKLSFYAGIVVSFPFLLWFLAGFVLPALTRQEKKLIFPGVLGGFVLFLFGALAAYKFVLPRTLKFFLDYGKDAGIDPMLDAGLYYSLVANLCLACGLLCELPIVIIALSTMGLVTFKLLSSTRAYAFTVILIIVAIIAPSPDPFTFMILGLPVLGIYEMCIWIVWLMERRREKQADKKD